MPRRPLRPPSSRASGKRSVAWPHGRRTPARYATVPLQNPLAPPPHGVFGLKTFTNQRPCRENRKHQLKINRPTMRPHLLPTAKRPQASLRKNHAPLPPPRRKRNPPRQRNQPPNNRHHPPPDRRPNLRTTRSASAPTSWPNDATNFLFLATQRTTGSKRAASSLRKRSVKRRLPSPLPASTPSPSR